MELNVIHSGDCLQGLKGLPDSCVDCCVTSPPYYRLRDYGVAGQLGLEETPELYVERLVEVFVEVYRVMKKTGTLWVVIGDSYNGSGKNSGHTCKMKWIQRTNTASHSTKPTFIPGLKRKNLIGVPWMLAFALRNAGWYLRQDIIWHKPNPIPENVDDRCTKAHEYIFLLSKAARYYFDHEAISEPATGHDGRKDTFYKGGPKDMAGGAHERWRMIDGVKMRNKRNVWTVNTQPYAEAHFATYPPALIVDCIKAGCPENGVVLDPFMGAGTTAVVARKLNRNYIGFELSPEYIKMAERRIKNELGMWL
jgi:DNA modification methylase